MGLKSLQNKKLSNNQILPYDVYMFDRWHKWDGLYELDGLAELGGSNESDEFFGMAGLDGLYKLDGAMDGMDWMD